MSMIIEESTNFFGILTQSHQFNSQQAEDDSTQKPQSHLIEQLKIKGLESIKKITNTQKCFPQIQLFQLPNLQQKIISLLHLKFSKLEPLIQYQTRFIFKESFLTVKTLEQRIWAVNKITKINKILDESTAIIVQMDSGKVKLMHKAPKIDKSYGQSYLLEKLIYLDIKNILRTLQTHKSFIQKIIMPNFKQNNQNSSNKINKVCQYIRISHLYFSFSTKIQQCSYSSLESQNRKSALFKNLKQNIDQLFIFPQKHLYMIPFQSERLLPSDHEFETMEQGQFGKHLAMPQPTNLGKGQNKYICNYIKIKQKSNCNQGFKPKQGGVSKIKIFRIKFIYISSYSYERSSKAENFQNKQFCQDNEIQKQGKQKSELMKFLACKQPKSMDKQFYKFEKNKIQHQKNIINELKGGVSAYILKYYVQSHTQKKNQILYMDYMLNRPNLYQFLQLNSSTLSVYSKIHVMISISNSLRFLNSYKIVHMDFNPSNIIIYTDFLTKTFDFGQSYHPKVCDQNYNPGYTLPFAPPQIFNKQKIFNYPQDVFSFGMIAFLMSLKQSPYFVSKQLLQVYKNKRYHQKLMLAPQKFSQLKVKEVSLLMMLLFKCLHQNQQFRPIPSWVTILLKQIYFI